VERPRRPARRRLRRHARSISTVRGGRCRRQQSSHPIVASDHRQAPLGSQASARRRPVRVATPDRRVLKPATGRRLKPAVATIARACARSNTISSFRPDLRMIPGLVDPVRCSTEFAPRRLRVVHRMVQNRACGVIPAHEHVAASVEAPGPSSSLRGIERDPSNPPSPEPTAKLAFSAPAPSRAHMDRSRPRGAALRQAVITLLSRRHRPLPRVRAIPCGA